MADNSTEEGRRTIRHPTKYNQTSRVTFNFFFKVNVHVILKRPQTRCH